MIFLKHVPVFLALGFSLFCPLTLQADQPLKVGSPAPSLKLRTVLGAPDGFDATWEHLRGEAVVLEFWATWCAGCVEGIPHMNQLAEQFKSRPIQFISITDETDVALVKRFLNDRPIKGWVAFDDNESTFNNFGVEGRPQTILVDSSGIFRGAVIGQGRVTAETLENLLGGRPLNFAEAPPPVPLGLQPHAPPPLFQVLIRPAAPTAVSGNSPGSVHGGPGRYEAYGLTMLDILSQAYDLPDNRIDAPPWCSASRYDFSIVLPKDGEIDPWPLVRGALESAFALQVHKEARDTLVYVLRQIDGLPPSLARATTASTTGKGTAHVLMDKGSLEGISYSIGGVARTAGRVLDAEVFDETQLTGRYDFKLNWNPKEPASIVEAIREQLHLDLATEHRRMEHLVVDSITEAKAP